MGDRLNKEKYLERVQQPRVSINGTVFIGFVEINGRIIREQTIGYIRGIDEGLIKTSDLWDIFKKYGDEKSCRKSLKLFLDGDFVWQRPNADITPFFHDPFTGEEIDWEIIKSAYLKPLKK